MPKLFTQSTPESCLACCLLLLATPWRCASVFRRHELACLIHALRFSKHDFVAGHLHYIHRHFSVRVKRIIDSKTEPRPLCHVKRVPGIAIERKPIDLNMLSTMLSSRPAIMYLDAYTLYHVHHYPHFIILLAKKRQRFLAFDPWDGKKKLLPNEIVSDSIQLLREHLRMCPQVIVIRSSLGYRSAPQRGSQNAR